MNNKSESSDLIFTSSDQIIISSSKNPNQIQNPQMLNPDSSDLFFKTRLCQNFRTKGVCQYKDECSFAHGLHELRNKGLNLPDLSESAIRVCKMYYRGGNCSYGAACSYLHVENNNNAGITHANERKVLYKAKHCFSFRNNGRCSYGASCIFVHAEEEARKTGSIMESEKGHNNSEVPEDSGRSNKNNIFKLPIMPPRIVSIQKPGSEKLQAMKKIVGIYGDWLD